MDRGRPVASPKGRAHRSTSRPHQMLSSSPLAEQALADDIAACSEDDANYPEGDDFSDPGIPTHGHVFNLPIEEPILTPLERKQSRNAERSLLRDNHVLPPKHAVDPKKKPSLGSRIYRRLFSTKLPPTDEEEAAAAARRPSETSPLLNGARPQDYGVDGESVSVDDSLEEQWEGAVASGRLRTTWQRETKTIVSYSAPLIATFFLQYSINVASIFAVGRIGKVELGAVSLANMSSAVTCLAPFQGLATSLDTLCAQAYGSGHKHLVGLQCQRMATFLLCLSAPVAVLWLFSEGILVYIVPDPESARLSSLYLKVMIFGIPGIVLFETGKRFLQAQGLFRATTYILLAAAPINIFINWLLVWKLGYGFVGAPIAVAITENLLPLFLFLYVVFVDGRQCWGGFSKRAFTNWWVMIRLALPGMIMVEAEWLAFEIMTLLSSRLGTEYLAAQSVLATLTTISYQIPFPMSIAASTRVANLIGAGLVDAAKITAKVTFVAACLIGVLNLTIYSTLRYHLPILFTNDDEVIALVAQVLPLVAVMQVFDGLSAGAHGLLRGIGKQSIGGPANLIAYYVISLPISLGLAFGLNWRLEGLWAGVTVGLIVVSLIEYIYLLKTDWHKAAAEAEARNQAG
ncbi:Multi antimicrobial extrusion protein [Purpureocillium lavendulum]|uniref:Multi antimicrobial extrusion protein n=1 Tax=Purpureocillium lavendulum TaxID=1247861 RepID=A0AB34G0F8_9HYPO|nr:Multi antimicrobial extrusion protein [Purpureocillium lavendulum]